VGIHLAAKNGNTGGGGGALRVAGARTGRGSRPSRSETRPEPKERTMLNFNAVLWIIDSDPTFHFDADLQGGSDKSGIFFFFLLNGTTQLKIIRFC
jgi:hypothetical protein